MKPSEIFLRSAAECEHMAKFALDRESKVAWRLMAQQWLRNAELFERKEAVPSSTINPHRLYHPKTLGNPH
jgi:hypothetical protein